MAYLWLGLGKFRGSMIGSCDFGSRENVQGCTDKRREKQKLHFYSGVFRAYSLKIKETLERERLKQPCLPSDA
jgi:hypothetical protein